MTPQVLEKRTVSARTPSRIVYIDALRIIAILAVIMLHCVSNYFVRSDLYGTPLWMAVNVINVFSRLGVPIFFMISGYLLLSDPREITIRDFMKRRLLKILLPFALWNAVYYVYNSLSFGTMMSLGDFAYRFITMDVSYHFWFVYTLILLYLIVPAVKPFFLRAKPSQLVYLLLTAVFPTTIGPLINKLFGIWLFRFEPLYLGYFGFVVLGFILGKINLPRRSRLLIYACGIFGALLSIFGTAHFSSLTEIDTFFNGGYGLSAYCVAAAVFVLVRQIFGEESAPLAQRIFGGLGKLSYGVYLIHVLVMDFLYKFIVFKSTAVNIIGSFFITVIASFCIIFVLSKIKYVNKYFI